MNNESKKKLRSRYRSITGTLNPLAWLFSSKSIASDGQIIRWGEDNDLPNKLFESCLNNVYPSTIINGTVEMIMGDGIEVSEQMKEIIRDMAFDYKQKAPDDDLAINSFGEDLEDIIKQAAEDLLTIGTYSDDLYFGPTGQISEHRYIDVADLRFIKDSKNVRISEGGWTGNSNGKKYDVPLFDKFAEKKTRSIFMHYNHNARTVYPLPYYFAGLSNIGIDTKINRFIHSSMDNNLTAFKILVYPGIPSEDEQDDLVENMKSTYTGVDGSRFMVFFKEGDEVPELVTIPDDNFADKFTALEETNNTKIFAAFRAQPVLFGILTKTTGFSEQEFFEAYKLYINTVVKAFRNILIRNISYIYGVKEPFKFIPTALERSIDQNMTNDVS